MKPIIVLLAALAALAAGAASRADTPIDQIVAVVDGDVVMASELESQMRRVLAQMRQQGAQPPPMTVFQKQVLDHLVMQKIQLGLAARTGIRVDDETLNQALGRIAADNKLTLAQFREIIEQDGLSFGRFREDIRNEITISRLRQREVENRTVVTDREIENQLGSLQQDASIELEYHLRHILVSVPADADQATRDARRAEIEAIRTEIVGGADFSAIARTRSEGSQAAQGGDLGWIKASSVPSIFADLVGVLRPGETSEILESDSGFHLLQVLGSRTGEQHVVDQTHAEHILIRPNELVSPEDASIRLQQLRIRIMGGESFENLARSHSDDRGTAVNGGDLGWVSPGDLVPEFEEEMNALAPGEVSEPFQTQFGLHIVRVLERRRHDDTEEVRRARAREIIRKRKIQEDGDAWMRRLRDEAYVEYRLN
ncbi:MAG: peptidylprolyl isomerase [Gammaproteobacteria bacterium]